MDDVLDDVSEGVLLVDGDWRVTRRNEVVGDLLGKDGAELVGADVRDIFPWSATATFHDHFEGDEATPAAVRFEEYFPELGRWLTVRTVPSDSGLAIFVRDVTDRKTLESDLEDREGELRRLNRINSIIEEVIQDLIGATTRDEVECTVCNRLAAADLYEYIWIGEPDAASGRFRHRIAAGEYDGIVDLGIEDWSGDDATASPEGIAVESGETQQVRELVADETVPEQIRREAFAHGLQSSIAIPIQYGTTTYGVIGIYATHPDAFSDRERESLETLGEVIGFVINSARQRKLLLSNTVLELTFRITDTDACLVALATEFDCKLTIEGIVPLDPGTIHCFVEVTGADPDSVQQLFDEEAGIMSGRVVRNTSTDDTAGGVVEVTLTGSSPLLVLVERGATVRVAEFDRDTGRIVAEMAPAEDVRELVEAVGRAHPGTELISKHERERSVQTVQEFRSSLHDRLTDRQRTVLRMAFHGGYFESPRDSTAEELADTLGISSPTFHTHLRTAAWKLLDAFLRDDSRHGRLRPDRRRSENGGVPDGG